MNHTFYIKFYGHFFLIGEALALEWKDIDFKKNELYIHSSKSTLTREIKELKNYEERFIKINNELSNSLKELRENSISNFVFNQINYEVASHALKKLLNFQNQEELQFMDLDILMHH